MSTDEMRMQIDAVPNDWCSIVLAAISLQRASHGGHLACQLANRPLRKLSRQAGKEFLEPSAAPAGKSVKVLDA
jgi:hypothetical protein